MNGSTPLRTVAQDGARALFSTLFTLAPVAILGLFGCGTVSFDDELVFHGTGAGLNGDSGIDIVGYNFLIEPTTCEDGSFTPADMLCFNMSASDLSQGVIQLRGDANGHPSMGGTLIVLEPGCYDVTASPARELFGEDDFEPSEDCLPATASGVVVNAEKTASVTLITQCN
ncbi:MAG: hypothetical protein AAFV53_32595 [Myxococcota bacterium]